MSRISFYVCMLLLSMSYVLQKNKKLKKHYSISDSLDVVNDISVGMQRKNPYLYVLRMLVENKLVPVYKRFQNQSRFKFSKEKGKTNISSESRLICQSMVHLQTADNFVRCTYGGPRKRVS